MNWHDEAIILGTRQYGETSAIVEVMTRSHGRHMGIVKGGRSRRNSAALQPGNRVLAQWWARLDEHLGSFKLEVTDFSASRLMETQASLYALQIVAAHLRLLPERDPHEALYEMASLLIDHYENTIVIGELLVRLELRLLNDLGFGLDLKSCAATGECNELIYVSPKSARAVSRQAGELWKDKLLALPPFLLASGGRPTDVEGLIAGFDLTGFFLERHVFEPRGINMSQTRDVFLRLLRKT